MPGRKPNGDTATTTFEPVPGPQVVTTVDTLTVTLAASAVRMLAATVVADTACAVPAEHPTHGTRLLGLRPSPGPGQAELYLTLPDAESHIVHSRHSLSAALAELADALAPENRRPIG